MSYLDFFKKRIRENDYSNLQEDLYKIRVARSAHDYVAQSILYSVAIGAILVISSFLTFFLFLNIYFPYLVGLSLGIGGGLGFVAYRIFLFYPSMRSTNREKEIEDMLPHAVAYMLALSKGGFEPINIFESLSGQEAYGEIAREAGAIVRNAKVLGYSPNEAIEDVAETSPSEEFRDFLKSFSSVIETGASTSEFLSRRADRYYDEADEKQEENLEFLGILSEVYVIGLGLGPIFGIVILIMFGMMGNFSQTILYMIVYLLIPLGTGAFVVILDMQSRTSFGKVEVSEHREESSGESFFSFLNRKINHSKDRLGSFENLVTAPLNVLWVTVPVGILIFYVLFSVFGLRIETAVTFFVLISLSPLAVLFEIKRKREENLIKIAPDFLNSFSDALSSGLSPSKALFFLTPDRYGVLESEIEKMRRDIEWGNSVSAALKRSVERLGGGIMSHIMFLVQRSSEVASDITGILDILAKDVDMERSLQQERARIASTYVIIVFMTFGIFLLTAYSLSTSIIPLMEQMSQPGAEVSGQSPIGEFGGINPTLIREAFFHASLIQGFASGLLAGMLQTGKISSGLKYSMIMLTVAWVFYTFLGI